MARKNYYLIADSETTQDDLVADFGAIICDSKGDIVNQCSVLVDGIFTDMESHPLFFDKNAPSDALWSRKGADKRYSVYNRMVKEGTRMIASVPAINNWLARAAAKYQPILTAYNLAFDVSKCRNTGIDLALFDRSFCLWKAAYTQWAHTKQFRKLVLETHAFNAPTKYGNMSFKTNAETMARFVLGNANLDDEPHTALEDVIYYELPILRALLKKRSAKWLLTETAAYNWRNCQVKDWFKP